MVSVWVSLAVLEGQKLGRSTPTVSNAYNSASEWTSIIPLPLSVHLGCERSFCADREGKSAPI